MGKFLRWRSEACFVLLLLMAFSAQAAPPISIGVSVPLSGSASSYGVDIKNALVFANKHLYNNAYNLIIEDDFCSDREAVTVAKRLIHVAKVKYALGFGCSGTVLSSASEYEKAKVLLIASGTGAPAITEAGDYIFRTKPSLKIAAKLLSDHMSARFKRVGILTEETAYCQGLSSEVVAATNQNITKIENELLPPNTTDFRAILSRLKSKKVEAVFINTQSEVGLIAAYKQLLGMGWKVQVYGTFQPNSPAFLQAFGKHADGLVFADLPFNEDFLNDRGLLLYEEFLKEYGAPNSGEHFVTLSWLAFEALDQAIKSGTDAKNYLYQSSFKGLIDDYSFDQNGDIEGENVTYVLKIIKDGIVTAINN